MGECVWGLYGDYYRDPFPHSLLSTRESKTTSVKTGDQQMSEGKTFTQTHERFMSF